MQNLQKHHVTENAAFKKIIHICIGYKTQELSKLRQMLCSKDYNNNITVNNIVPFVGGASTLGTCGIFSSGAGFLVTSGTSDI